MAGQAADLGEEDLDAVGNHIQGRRKEVGAAHCWVYYREIEQPPRRLGRVLLDDLLDRDKMVVEGGQQRMVEQVVYKLVPRVEHASGLASARLRLGSRAEPWSPPAAPRRGRGRNISCLES